MNELTRALIIDSWVRMEESFFTIKRICFTPIDAYTTLYCLVLTYVLLINKGLEGCCIPYYCVAWRWNITLPPNFPFHEPLLHPRPKFIHNIGAACKSPSIYHWPYLCPCFAPEWVIVETSTLWTLAWSLCFSYFLRCFIVANKSNSSLKSVIHCEMPVTRAPALCLASQSTISKTISASHPFQAHICCSKDP